MMIFALEALSKQSPELLGPHSKAYVERVHNRYVSLICRNVVALFICSICVL